jgi:DNA-directed RNA polymerase subunit alpha
MIIDQNKVNETNKEIKERYLVLRSVFDLVREEINKVEMKYINNILLKELWDFEFSVRVMNAFKNDGINHLGDLVIKSEGELLRMPNFGRKSLIETKEILKELGLELDMNVIWPPKILKKEDMWRVV